MRLLYLYPSELNDRLVDTICSTGIPYFDLSLQHVAKGFEGKTILTAEQVEDVVAYLATLKQ